MAQPSHEEMFVSAILALKDKQGLSAPQIANYLAANYSLPESFEDAILSTQLKYLCRSGKLFKEDGAWVIHDPAAAAAYAATKRAEEKVAAEAAAAKLAEEKTQRPTPLRSAQKRKLPLRLPPQSSQKRKLPLSLPLLSSQQRKLPRRLPLSRHDRSFPPLSRHSRRLPAPSPSWLCGAWRLKTWSELSTNRQRLRASIIAFLHGQPCIMLSIPSSMQPTSERRKR
jgi:hypothetical protein